MNKITLFGIPLEHPPTSHPSTIPSTDPHERSRLAPYRWTEVQRMAEHDIELPGWESLVLILEAALTSRDLDFVAAMRHPSRAKLDDHCPDFVLSCAETPIESEAP